MWLREYKRVASSVGLYSLQSAHARALQNASLVRVEAKQYMQLTLEGSAYPAKGFSGVPTFPNPKNPISAPDMVQAIGVNEGMGWTLTLTLSPYPSPMNAEALEECFSSGFPSELAITTKSNSYRYSCLPMLAN